MRKIAHQIWRESPNLSFEEMIAQPEIQKLLPQDYLDYPEELKKVFEFLDTPEKDNTYLDSPLWDLNDAISFWFNLNPFLCFQIYQQKNPLYSSRPMFIGMKDRWTRLYKKAKDAALLDELKTIPDKDRTMVRPRDFYEWGTINAEEPDIDSNNIFSVLKTKWNEEDAKLNPPPKSKSLTKVEIKKLEIKRILGLIKEIDPEFDSMSMTGTRKDFKELCVHLNKPAFLFADSTFNDYLKGVCKFKPGGSKTNYYSSLQKKLSN